jgi:hypothetical protein
MWQGFGCHLRLGRDVLGFTLAFVFVSQDACGQSDVGFYANHSRSISGLFCRHRRGPHELRGDRAAGRPLFDTGPYLTTFLTYASCISINMRTQDSFSESKTGERIIRFGLCDLTASHQSHSYNLHAGYQESKRFCGLHR